MTTDIVTKPVTKASVAPNWEIRECVIFSTAHCRPKTADGKLFSGKDAWRLYGVTDYGAQYYLGDDLSLLEDIKGLTQAPEWPLLKAVVEAGFVEVRFESDGREVPEFAELYSQG